MTKWKWSNIWWMLSCTSGVIGLAFACYIASRLFYVPKGSYIRPIGFAFAIIIDAIVVFLIGFLPGIVSVFKTSHKKIAIIGALLNLLPYPTFVCITKIAIALRDLHVSG